MATGRSNKLVGQAGEYLVAAELSRRGLIATTFTGNVPDYDIIASDAKGRHVSVQVKASTGGSWQFGDITRYCDLTFKEHRQVVGKPKPCPVRRLVVVFVTLGVERGDHFYILPWRRLRDLLVRQHVEYLRKHGGVRPKRWDSMHTVIMEKTLQPYRDQWQTIERNLK